VPKLPIVIVHPILHFVSSAAFVWSRRGDTRARQCSAYLATLKEQSEFGEDPIKPDPALRLAPGRSAFNCAAVEYNLGMFVQAGRVIGKG
jgi:hypothetical protein